MVYTWFSSCKDPCHHLAPGYPNYFQYYEVLLHIPEFWQCDDLITLSLYFLLYSLSDQSLDIIPCYLVPPCNLLQPWSWFSESPHPLMFIHLCLSTYVYLMINIYPIHNLSVYIFLHLFIYSQNSDHSQSYFFQDSWFSIKDPPIMQASRRFSLFSSSLVHNNEPGNNPM